MSLEELLKLAPTAGSFIGGAIGGYLSTPKLVRQVVGVLTSVQRRLGRIEAHLMLPQLPDVPFLGAEERTDPGRPR